MASLRNSDLQAALRVAGEMADAGVDPALFARIGVESLPRAVASEITTLSICDLASNRRHVVGSPGSRLGAEDRACFDRHFTEHPLVRYHAHRRGAGAHRISDSLPFARFRHSALYGEYYRRIGIDHVVAVPIAVDSRTLVSFVLNRKRRDFSDREVALLDVVGGLLARQYRRVSAATRASEGARPGPAAALLTAREREVVGWVAAGKTDRDIAALLGCSHRTIQKHLERSYVKLGVETRTAAAMRMLGVTVG
jgi:DNA-binding CsgD family transcriptional regulator